MVVSYTEAKTLGSPELVALVRSVLCKVFGARQEVRIPWSTWLPSGRARFIARLGEDSSSSITQLPWPFLFNLALCWGRPSTGQQGE